MKPQLRRPRPQPASVALVIGVLLLLTGCPHERVTPTTPPPSHPVSAGARSELTLIDLSDPIRPTPLASPIKLHAAAEEWTSVTLAVSNVQPSAALQLRVHADGRLLDVDHFRAYQVLPAPIELNPDYVRHTGLNTASRALPRVLLPIKSKDGVIDLTQLRDPAQPTNPAAHPNGDHVLIWLDFRVPATAAASTLQGQFELRSAGKVIGSQAMTLSVYDFALPRERHLQMVGNLSWARLAALYPDAFGDTITPALINRRQGRYAATVRTLDQLVALAEENRLTLSIPGLHPTVKWPTGEAPEIDWREYDAMVGPWLDGTVFADRVGLGYWPLPAAQSLDRYDPQSRLDYWRLAAEHFEHLKKLEQCPISLTPPAGEAESAALLSETAKVLQANENVRVTLALEDAQIDRSTTISAADRFRIYASAPGLMSVARTGATTQPGNAAARNRVYALRTDASDVPYFGAGGSERDVRVWAWLAFLRQAGVVLWDQTLPQQESPLESTDAGQVAWFYPGSWYGVDQPVPTMQLKWLRRAQQDYEYLWLSKERGEPISALQMARLISKPLEIQPGQAPDPAYALLCGTPDAQAWDRAQELLAAQIVLHTPGRPVDPDQQRALYIQTLQWAEPLERPLLVGHAAQWTLARNDSAPTDNAGNWVNLKFGIDIYNASDTTPNRNVLRWTAPPPDSGWQVNPESAVEVPKLQTYHVEPAAIGADFNLDRINASALTPLTVTFVNGYSNAPYRLSTRIPIAATDRREGPLKLDGRLDEWNNTEAIQDGPMVLMMNRPALQDARLEYASHPARIYSCWGAENFYLGFQLEGLSGGQREAHNDVHYQARRAWDEDLAEVLVQPIFADNSVGPVTHVVLKPNGVVWTERKDKAGANVSWGSVEGAAVRYATTNTADGLWRGEASIPWKLLSGGQRPIPVLLRFNFTQHRNADCESASWCGPVDFGRDDQLTGVLYVRTRLDRSR